MRRPHDTSPGDVRRSLVRARLLIVRGSPHEQSRANSAPLGEVSKPIDLALLVKIEADAVSRRG